MKKLSLLFLSLLILTMATAQNWTWKNPLPQGNTLNGVKLTNDRTVQVGKIIKE
jgi:hypothetical protein